jgi:biotin transport system substrate-specific component
MCGNELISVSLTRRIHLELMHEKLDWRKIMASRNKLHRPSLQWMAMVAIMAAVMCVVAPFSIPIGPVPISFATLAIYVFAILLGAKGATAGYLIYLLLGAVGIPVFTGFEGGLQKLAGPTGGYLIAMIILAAVCGYAAERRPGNRAPDIIIYVSAMLGGTAIIYALGTLWLAKYLEISFVAALAVGVIPFLLGDAAKMVFAVALGFPLRKALRKANLLA